MKRFILVFTLSLLFLSFAAAFLYLAKYKNIPLDTNKTTEPVSTEAPLATTQPLENKGPSVYEPYSKQRYDSALKENRIMVLYFTANWSEGSRIQEEVNQEVFGSLMNEGVVGLSVHILDSQATTETASLAQKFSVANEDILVILDSKGAVFLKADGPILKENLITEIKKAMEVK